MIRATAIGLSLFLATPAFAQQPQTVTLTLSTSDVQEIWTALGERPAKFSGPVMSKIQEQVGKQVKPADPEQPAPKK